MKTRNIDAYRQLHEERRYGNTAVRMRRFVEPWMQLAKPGSVLDYGAGQGGFVDILDLPSAVVRDSYDPAIPQIAARPERAYDMVVCIDVMEHIEPNEVADVLADIATFSPNALFIIDTEPARAILPDGRNAHTTLEPAHWWKGQIEEAFGHAAAVPVFRKGRCAFKTYPSSKGVWLRFLRLLVVEEVAYQLWRLRGGRFADPKDSHSITRP
ncbi:MAG: methyltransferase domain-containing protein [Pseudomonadota bacterium]